jgi:hypothetical protein
MKKLDYPVSIEQLAFRNVEITHFQNAYFEGFAGIMSAYATASADQGFKISGCEVSVAGTTYTCTAGVICLKGEIFNVPENSIVLPDFHEVYFDVFESAVSTESPAPNRDGGTSNTRLERIAKLVVNSNPPASRMSVNAKTYDKLVFDKSHSYGELIWLDPRFEGKIMSDYFNMTTGVGLVNTLYDGYILLGVYAGTSAYLKRALVSLDLNDTDLNAVGKIYGSKTQSLTVPQLPSHTHRNKRSNTTAGDGEYFVAAASGSASVGPTDGTVEETGGGEAHNNMQPSIVAALVTKYHPDIDLS